MSQENPRRISFPVALVQATDAVGDNGCSLATGAQPWLTIAAKLNFTAGPWIEIIYTASYLDAPLRPLLRCIGHDFCHDEILPAAVLGRAIWRGPLPPRTQMLRLSPVGEAGPSTFHVESLRIMTMPEVYARAMMKSPGKAWRAWGLRLRGKKQAARRLLRLAVGPTQLQGYDAWRLQRMRVFDPAGLDCPRGDVGNSPCIVVLTDAADAAWVTGLVQSLQQQAHANWQVVWVRPDAQAKAILPDEPRLTGLQPGAALQRMLGGLPDDALLACIPSGARLDACALPVLAQAAAKYRLAQVFYGDEDAIDPKGRYHAPRFKPGWNPVLFAGRDYLGAARFCRATLLRDIGSAASVVELEALMRQRLAGCALSADLAQHIARIVMTLPLASREPDRAASPMATELQAAAEPSMRDRVAVIIPTKNQRDLLACCIASLQSHDSGCVLDIIVVDNGSTDEAALSYLDDLAAQTGIQVLRCPGPFNFSHLCNEGAAANSAPFLVFLNNDTEIIAADWLRKLLVHARRAEIGAVGAKLLYPDRRVQHGGVVLGIDGRAGHFERLVDELDDGYFRRLNVAHEAAAVTGACLAVERVKFMAIGGFDAVNLPVELNDIDLCLRLGERGWATIMAAHVVLLHHESASRRKAGEAAVLYASERTYFRARWMPVLRRSPGFHPALSLDGLAPALG